MAIKPLANGDHLAGDPLAGYRPRPGVPDELMDASGRVRPAWRRFIDHFSSLGAEDIAQRFARGDEYLRDAGVFFRQYGDTDSPERDWPLSHVPVLIHEDEWRAIAAGLVQRADLLEMVVSDLYGPQRLVAGGHLPGSLIAASPEWLRPMVGIAPRSGHFLNFLSFELGRGPDGRWWVLADRAQAPSGAGFALENRVATARVFSDLYAEANVHRLAGFFRAFRDTLASLGGEGEGRAAILTPGPMNDTYYEHAYIARYLGMMLLEGEDLMVEDGRVMVRTVSGPQPVNVLWRRLDSAWADPIELNGASSIGAAGLVEAVRRGNVAIVNALGTGILETRALMAFLPRISQTLNGEKLAIPNVATWWCGEPGACEHVLANAKAMTIGAALSTRPSFETIGEETSGWARATPEDSIADRLRLDGHLLVGQEAVTLSTTPAYAEGRLEPRATTLRVFLARSRDGWRVMPGGYARIGRSDEPSALAMQRGGAVADVWIVSDRSVDSVTMLPAASAPYIRPDPGTLPSRAADNLFWLGRYVERAEETMRFLRAWHGRLAETGHPDTPLLAFAAEHLKAQGVDVEQPVPAALQRMLKSAIIAAGKVRDRFSIDGWMALNDLARTTARMSATVEPGEDAARAMSVLLRKITGFSGLVHENMYRFTGWRFLTVGRSLERAYAMASLLADFADATAPDGALDFVVEVGDSAMSHRRRFAVSTTRETVIDLLALDTMNPRSILYHLGEMHEQIDVLPDRSSPGRASPLARAILQLHAGLAVRTPEEVASSDLAECGHDIAHLSDLISDAYLR
ncbi:circularly permuted type 2 ATP-grasp protein [Mesorhizobium sp. CAU 1741]|uniref:circularly permuted type 2 ATP-grasp protein n=1 Tax=Mesorhizobium sp. CAU 1741 TaxID=3140366 RepID=UPI00325BE8F2